MAVVLLLLAGESLFAQQSAYPESNPYESYSGQRSEYGAATYAESAPVRQALDAGQLEQLVAPIALYPDALVAQVLAASTYPQQVEEADRWRQAQGYATPEQVAYGADAQPWDPAVKALTAFPRVLEQMDRNQQWTTDLGNAYFNQPQDVLEAVQVMRRRAQAAGNLRSTPQEVVRYDEDNIALAPADPQMVYVPAYNPWAVYGEPVSPYPGFSLLGAIGDFFGGDPIRYGLGIALSAFTHTPWGWLAWGLNWLTQSVLFHSSDYYSHSDSVADWGFSRHEHHAYWDHGGFGRGREFGRMGNEGWRHGGGGGWHEFGRGVDRRGVDGRGFNRRAGDWGGRSGRGFESFRGERGSMAGYRSGSTSRMSEGRGEYRFALNRGGAFDRGAGLNRGGAFGRGGRESYRGSAGSFGRGEFGGRSSGGFGRASGKAHSGGLHLFGGGHSQKGFGGGGGGFHGGGFHGGGGGGHAPKFHGGGGHFGGGHSHGGGHSGGHSGGRRR